MTICPACATSNVLVKNYSLIIIQFRALNSRDQKDVRLEMKTYGVVSLMDLTYALHS